MRPNPQRDEVVRYMSPATATAVFNSFRKGLALTAAWYGAHKGTGKRRIIVRADPSETPEGMGIAFDAHGEIMNTVATPYGTAHMSDDTFDLPWDVVETIALRGGQ